MVVLDSSFLIDVSSSVPAAIREAKEWAGKSAPFRVPAIAWTEFLHVYAASERRVQENRLESFSTFEPFGRPVAEEAVQIQHDLANTGRRLGWSGVQVAAT